MPVYAIIASILYAACVFPAVVILFAPGGEGNGIYFRTYAHFFLFPALFLPLILIVAYPAVRDYVRRARHMSADLGGRDRLRGAKTLIPALIALGLTFVICGYEFTLETVAPFEVVDVDSPGRISGMVREALVASEAGPTPGVNVAATTEFPLHSLLRRENIGGELRSSRLRLPYWIAFSALIGMVVMSYALIVLYTLEFKMPGATPNFGIQGGLTLVLAGWIAWLPFRAANWHYKTVFLGSAHATWLSEIGVGVLLFAASLILLVGWLAPHKELILGVGGAIGAAGALGVSLSMPGLLAAMFANLWFVVGVVVVYLSTLLLISLYVLESRSDSSNITTVTQQS